ncbi:hypothetical protein [Corynebacterium timonense]|uniref:Uncharacterized protein n=1 Tax=Corynebacterium timonense TaxID=441500 RepID=A0A1H1PK13_9CORY|nr:hypothetical protein [Corynebacterium timonense]SDS11437.1 hypothetical protein SAMN04488539_1036 [Corynebacterium timonense]
MKAPKARAAAAAAALTVTLAPAAHAVAPTQGSPAPSAAPTITPYSAMVEILSCRYYPTRPWCPNNSRYA